MSKSCIFRVGGVGRDYCTAREYEKGAEITSTLETTDTEKQKQRRKVSKQKKPCLKLVNKISSDEAKYGDSLDSSVGNLSLVVPSDEAGYNSPPTPQAPPPPDFEVSLLEQLFHLVNQQHVVQVNHPYLVQVNPPHLVQANQLCCLKPHQAQLVIIRLCSIDKSRSKSKFSRSSLVFENISEVRNQHHVRGVIKQGTSF
ncbi:unnamed protein product [Orchesella dallaii]|uniref:Uncharacterized protein n=1 Tax=Orchesella dallaii TaxID=48710 RepID=A0ABP1RW44_9HEXA